MPFTICLVFQDGQNKFGRSGSLLYHYFFNPCLHPDNDDYHKNVKLETLFKVGQFLKCNEIQTVKPHLSKLGLSYRWDSDVIMDSNKQTGPQWCINIQKL